MKKTITTFCYCLLVWLFTLSNDLRANNLPSLGDASSGIVSSKTEYQLGRAFLGALRQQVGVIDDPLLQDFIETSVYKLAETSQLQSRDLEFIVIDSPQINAFAAVGGIIGVNGGIFLHADTEAEYASVIAHELAHLSQRHYARRVESHQKLQIPLMAAILAGVVATAAGSPDLGMAAIASSQAAAFQSGQGFSRQNEQEADRIGIINLAKAGYDPRAMPNMFERMLRQYRYGERAPEFLLTHPITESRIADTKGRAELLIQNQKNSKLDTQTYKIMQMRIQLHYAKSVTEALHQFKIKQYQEDNHVYTYAYILALLKDNQADLAVKLSTKLVQEHSHDLYFKLLNIETLLKAEQFNMIEPLISKLIKDYPNSYIVKQSYIDYLITTQQWQTANKVVNDLLKTRAFDAKIWQQSAGVKGQIGDLLGLHQAQAEYLILHGEYDKALQQLNLAKIKSGNNVQILATIDNREQQVMELKKIIRQLM